MIEIFPDTSLYYLSFSRIEALIKEIGYQRGQERGVKVLFQKKGYPNIWVAFVPCSFVASPLVDDPVRYCKGHQAIYIGPDLTSQPCFQKPNQKVSIKNEVKSRNEGGLIRKIKLIRANIGQNCPLL